MVTNDYITRLRNLIVRTVFIWGPTKTVSTNNRVAMNYTIFTNNGIVEDSSPYVNYCICANRNIIPNKSMWVNKYMVFKDGI